MQKDIVIMRALEYLRQALGDNSFVLTDHWSEDRMAVGIAHPEDTSRLIYIACYDANAECYAAILERSPPADLELPYEECGHFDSLDMEGLVAVVSAHLQC